MKFLAVTNMKDSFGMLPPEAKLKLTEVCIAEMQREIEEGKISEFYFSPKGSAVVIFSYETADEWAKERNKNPFLNYLDMEIYPLADGMASLRGMLESIQAMMK